MKCTICKKPLKRPMVIGGITFPFHQNKCKKSALKKPKANVFRKFGMPQKNKVRLPDYALARTRAGFQ